MYNGILNVYKEKGYTSHDVVAKLRGILKQKKIGHTGTLDPDAEGVLPICLGKGTKLCDMLEDKDKTYLATLLLGQATDTQDTSGKLIESREVQCSELEVREAINSFIGDYYQIPPMYSALKVNGKKLYELAREGKTIEREARLVQIYKIEIKEINLPRVKIEVSCSKGTYIRTLCNDIGEKLGCLGCMEELKRMKANGLAIEDSLKIDEIADLKVANQLSERIVPIEYVFRAYPAIVVDERYNKLIYNGNQFSRECVKNTEVFNQDYNKVRVYDETKAFIGIYKYDTKREQFSPVKMFLGE
ncbi:tRNA pseudouridine(55) synthase TruB [Candidatus Galacturonibacter soehngenii]|uniref:tRNA pseudouridine synthase B n=1 Tax=Candidatus Galacturonatibacter soehngenii TaxID=2307010 RepID=A0A7V7UBC3_9FIRM|nr:tRNA pseudouridine(55) synthase TruB [Candidatus Galacturonibacter soehngenii]KAB1437625.1 tRNA pseudouridine(55) synthase TruB [Candidatus Galacturonibacter soehngenii]MBA4686851.1 tRNA pseudouridine(55) synthase TruB [Candidatus Galacturonibacter soehngenii]